MPDLMTTAEVAAYLRLKERKVYDLIRNRRIPCSRVAGKWLFPKRLIDLWVSQAVEYRETLAVPPPVVAGSHDPLLEWALGESGAELALLAGGSADGLDRLAAGKAVLTGLHIHEPETGGFNAATVQGWHGLHDLVLVEWAWREQGLVVAPGNPLDITSPADLIRRGLRLAVRQEAAGSQILLRHLLADAGLAYETLQPAGPPALTETELAATVLDGQADGGVAVRAVADRFRLGFVPLARERFDLAMRRRDYFEPAVQRLLAFTRTPAFAARAAALGGYDVSTLGRIVYNA